MRTSSFLLGVAAVLGLTSLASPARADELVHSYAMNGETVTVTKAADGTTTATTKWAPGVGSMGGKTMISRYGGDGISGTFTNHTVIGTNGLTERTWGTQSTTSFSPSRAGTGTDYVTHTTGRDYSGHSSSYTSQGTLCCVSSKWHR
jgi:hypothetical protein